MINYMKNYILLMLLLPLEKKNVRRLQSKFMKSVYCGMKLTLK